MAMVLRSLRQKRVPFILLNRNLQQFFVSANASNLHKEDAKVEVKPKISESLPTSFECKSGKDEFDDPAYVASQLKLIQRIFSLTDNPKSQKDIEAFEKLLEKEPQLQDPISQKDHDAIQNLYHIAFNAMRRDITVGVYEDILFGMVYRPFKVGDIIQSGETVGVVFRKRLLCTVLEYERGKVVAIRNSEIASERTKILKRSVGWFEKLFGGRRD